MPVLDPDDGSNSGKYSFECTIAGSSVLNLVSFVSVCILGEAFLFRGLLEIWNTDCRSAHLLIQTGCSIKKL